MFYCGEIGHLKRFCKKLNYDINRNDGNRKITIIIIPDIIETVIIIIINIIVTVIVIIEI